MSTNPTTATSGPQPSPDFYKTQDSDEWVTHTFHVQPRYSRVLLVSQGDNPPKTIAVPPLDLNARSAVSDMSNRPGSPAGPAVEYKVDQVFSTLQAASDEARGGDLVAVCPGTYDHGVTITPRPDAGDGKYVHYKALGAPGEVTIQFPPEDRSRGVCFRVRGSYVIIQGFNLAGRSGPGQPWVGSYCGIILGGGFAQTGRLTHHVAILDNFSHNHWKWGFTSVESHTVLMQDNCFAFSADEHGAYASDSSDNYVIRRNVFFGNNKGGLQCNLDADTSLRNLSHHPDLAAVGPFRKDHDYAMKLIEAATKRFGPNNFMDGRGINFIIEQNVSNGNGRDGGGSFNLSALQESLIQNNLSYGNGAHGITLYNNSAASFDRTFVLPGPSRPEEVAGPQSLGSFGSHSNLVRNNTVLLAHPDRPERFALGMVNGSYGNLVRNNILIIMGGDSIEVTGSSIWRLDSGYNVVNTIRYASHYAYGADTDLVPTTMPESFKALAVHVDETNHTIGGVTLDQIAPDFVRYGEQPWVVVEGNWWRLNPDRPDFHPKAGDKLLTGWGDKAQMPAVDLLGEKRTQPDIGAFSPPSGKVDTSPGQ